MSEPASLPAGLLPFARLLSEPWAVTEAFAETALDILFRQGEGPEAVAARLGRPLDNTRGVEMRDGVAVVPVMGPIFRHANLLTEVSGATSLGQTAIDLHAALDDPAVGAILLDVDSPGGQAKGVGELADMIRAGTARKPIVAYVGGMAASGGYWLAAAASRVVAHPTASLGSIGAVLRVIDRGLGKGEHQFVSSISPHKRPDLASDDGRAPIQAEIDDLGRQFLEAVAGFRGVTAEHAVERFGKGATMLGPRALAAGMVDALGSLEGVLGDLHETITRGRGRTAKGTGMTAQATGAAGQAAPDTNTDDVTARLAAAHGEGFAAGKADGLKEGAAAEKARIATILNSEHAEGRAEAARSFALDTSMSAEEAVTVMAKLPKASPAGAGATPFEQAMAGVPNPKIGPDAGGGGVPGTAADEDAMVAAIVAFDPNRAKRA